MRKLGSICIVFFFLSLAYFQAYADEETTTILSHIYGINEVKEIEVDVSIEKAEAIAKDLKELKNAIEIDDDITALKIASKLKKEGLFSDKIFDLIRTQLKNTAFPLLNQENSTMNITNVLCVVLGFGEGLFVYSLDLLAMYFIVLLFGWMPLGILLVFIYSMLWLSLSHFIPVRTVMPLTLFAIGEGELLTAGLKGITSIKPENNETTIGMLVGFIGVIINIYIFPKEGREEIAQFFCIGHSLLALKEQPQTMF